MPCRRVSAVRTLVFLSDFSIYLLVLVNGNQCATPALLFFPFLFLSSLFFSFFFFFLFFDFHKEAWERIYRFLKKEEMNEVRKPHLLIRNLRPRYIICSLTIMSQIRSLIVYACMTLVIAERRSLFVRYSSRQLRTIARIALM